MRPRTWLLLAAFLFLVGLWPAIATVIGGTVGLALTGALQLLSQPAVFALAVGLLAVGYFRRRPAPARRTA